MMIEMTPKMHETACLPAVMVMSNMKTSKLFILIAEYAIVFDDDYDNGYDYGGTSCVVAGSLFLVSLLGYGVAVHPCTIMLKRALYSIGEEKKKRRDKEP